MDLHKWNILNADKEVIGTVITSGKNRHSSVEKAYHKLGARLTFCKVKYSGLYTDNR